MKPELVNYLAQTLGTDISKIDFTHFDINSCGKHVMGALSYFLQSHEKVILSEEQLNYLIDNNDYGVAPSFTQSLMLGLSNHNFKFSPKIVDKINQRIKNEKLHWGTIIFSIGLKNKKSDVIESYFNSFIFLFNQLIEQKRIEDKELIDLLVNTPEVCTSFFNYLSEKNKEDLIQLVRTRGNVTFFNYNNIQTYLIEKENEILESILQDKTDTTKVIKI